MSGSASKRAIKAPMYCCRECSREGEGSQFCARIAFRTRFNAASRRARGCFSADSRGVSVVEGRPARSQTAAIQWARASAANTLEPQSFRPRDLLGSLGNLQLAEGLFTTGTSLQGKDFFSRRPLGPNRPFRKRMAAKAPNAKPEIQQLLNLDIIPPRASNPQARIQ